MTKKRVETRRQPATKKVKTAVRAKSRVAPGKKTASKRSVRKAAPTTQKKNKNKPSDRRQPKPLSTAASAEPTRTPATSTDPKPQAFWDPQGGQTDVTGDTKVHTKPEDQRAHIRMTASRTWSNRQPGRG